MLTLMMYYFKMYLKYSNTLFQFQSSLKRQDKVLKKRLQDLGAAIEQMRVIQSCPSLAHSRASISSGTSWFSLDEDNISNRNDVLTAANQRDNLWAFRARMVAEFQKSNPSLLVHSKVNVTNSEEDLKQLRPHQNLHPSSSCSSAGGVFLASSCSSGDDDNDKLEGLASLSCRSDSFISSVEEEENTGDFATNNDLNGDSVDRTDGRKVQFSNDEEENEANNDDDGDENNTLKMLKKKLRTLSSDSSSDEDQDSVTYEDCTLTRGDLGDKTMTDSLEDILTAVSSAEERQGIVEGEEEVEYMV